MISVQDVGGIENSWFELDAQKRAVHQDKFLSGLEILASTSGNDYPLIDHLFRQLETADLPNWPEAHRVKGAALKLSKEWPRVAIGNQAVRLPRTALEQISPKFKAQLKAGMQETENNCITLEAPDEIALPALKYLRTGEIVIDGNNVMELLYFACHHLLDDLRRHCEAYIQRHLSWDAFSPVLGFALMEALPALQCATLSFAQNNPDEAAFRRLPQDQQELVALARELFEQKIYLAVSPEGQAALTIEWTSDFDEPRTLKLLKKIGKWIPFKCLVCNQTKLSELETLEKIAPLFPQLEELVLYYMHFSYVWFKIGRNPLLEMKRLFPNLRSFGCQTNDFEKLAQLREYLELFAVPGEDPQESGRLRLRALDLKNLYTMTDLTDEYFRTLMTYLRELYFLKIKTDKNLQLDLPKSIELWFDSCPGLTSISVPLATKVHCGCSPGVTQLSAPSALEVSCRASPGITALSAPLAISIDCSMCPKLTHLSAPAATKVRCADCRTLTTLLAPHAESVDCHCCYQLTTIEAPLFTNPLRTNIYQLIAEDEREPRHDRYRITVTSLGGISETALKITHDADDVHGRRAFVALNDIPYFNKIILDAVVQKGLSALAAKNYEAAVRDAGYALAQDPAQDGAKSLMAAALEALHTDPIDASEPAAKRTQN